MNVGEEVHELPEYFDAENQHPWYIDWFIVRPVILLFCTLHLLVCLTLMLVVRSESKRYKFYEYYTRWGWGSRPNMPENMRPSAEKAEPMIDIEQLYEILKDDRKSSIVVAQELGVSEEDLMAFVYKLPDADAWRERLVRPNRSEQ